MLELSSMTTTRKRRVVTPRGKRSGPPAAARGLALGAEIKRAREERGWRLRDLAKACGRGMSAPKLCRLETGQERIRLDELERIAGALDLSIGEFLGLAAAKPKKPRTPTRKPAVKAPAKKKAPKAKPTKKAPTRRKAALTRVDAPAPNIGDMTAAEMWPPESLERADTIPDAPQVMPELQDDDAPIEVVREQSEEIVSEVTQHDVPPLVDLDADTPRSAATAVA